MGRQLRRVPLDFDWPLNVIWKGFISPYRRQECKPCDSSGLNPETKKINDDWYTHLRTDDEEGWMYSLTQNEVQALVDGNRLMDLTHRPRTQEQLDELAKSGSHWLKESNGYVPTAEEVNRWARGPGMGHDSINHWICVEVRAKRLGVWGKCKYCEGTGEHWADPKFKKLAEEWENIPPPEGEGYQLWENCSEGSPVSPVFKTLEELCEYAEVNCTTFGSSRATKEQWMKMLNADFVHHTDGNLIFL